MSVPVPAEKEKKEKLITKNSYFISPNGLRHKMARGKSQNILKYFSSFAAVKIGKKKCAPSFVSK